MMKLFYFQLNYKMLLAMCTGVNSCTRIDDDNDDDDDGSDENGDSGGK